MGDYDKSKAMASLEVMKAAADGLDAVIVCPTGVIGPHDYKSSEMGTLIRNAVTSRLLFSIEGAYDFVDVRDVASGAILAGRNGRKGETYILSGEWIKIHELLEIREGDCRKQGHPDPTAAVAGEDGCGIYACILPVHPVQTAVHAVFDRDHPEQCRDQPPQSIHGTRLSAAFH